MRLVYGNVALLQSCLGGYTPLEPIMDDMITWSPETGENPKKAPRPYHKPSGATRKVVASAVGMGLDQVMISKLLDINPKTLRKFYRMELDTGAAKANLNVARSLYGRATSGKDTIASIFWLKARAGWVDTAKHVHEGIPENITVTFSLDAPDAVAIPSLANAEPEVIDVTPQKQKEIE